MNTILLRIPLCALACLLFSILYSQDNAITKFGKIDTKDFNPVSPVIDSTTNAVILSDIGTSQIDCNDKGHFSLIYTHFRRVKILNKKGFDAADVSIRLYSTEGDEEKLVECKAVTYNLDNGNIVETKLESSNIFREKLDKNNTITKFTFPNVRDGSIIEYTYTVTSHFLFNLQPWEFQGTSWPRLYTRYTVKIPDFFHYVFFAQGYVPLKNTNKSVSKTYTLSLNGYENENTWEAKDVPPLKEEEYTSTINNHISKIDFQLNQIQFPQSPVQDVIGSWSKAAKTLIERADFGAEIDRLNNWLTSDVKNITARDTTLNEKAKTIYAYVRDNFTVTREYGIFISYNTTLKDVYKKRSGNIGEINLLLIAMLRQVGIPSYPVLISTRKNGWASSVYPLMDKYNYVICEAEVDNEKIFLDATKPKMGFAKLSTDCYNGPGFVVKEQSEQIIFIADSIKESKTTVIFLATDEKNGLDGTYISTPGYYESTELRKKLVKQDFNDLIKEHTKRYSFPVKIKNAKIDSLNNYENPVTVNYGINFNFNNQDIIYLSPMFTEATTKNPFASAERKYPVEIPFKIAETYVLNMEIPKGYKVEEIPKSIKVKLNETEGYFEYMISATSERIILTSNINIKKANFQAEDYQTLRNFFGYIVKKHAEQIVLKKEK